MNIDKLYEQKRKMYLTPLIFVTVLNLGLGAFLLHTVFGQTPDDSFRDQAPIIAEVLSQKECPLLITVINVDNSAPDYQRVNFVVQNISSKPVRAYALLGNRKTGGKIITTTFATKLLQPNEAKTDDFFEERVNIKPSEVLTFSIDYVEFDGAESWGDDIQKKSKQIAGERAGRKVAIQYFKDLIKNQDTKSLTRLMEGEIAQMTAPSPDAEQDEEWQKGFQRGYKSVVAILRRNKKEGIETLSKDLAEMEKLSN